MPATSADDRPRALVTGGARGIGAAICGRLAERGDDVVVADLDEQAAAGTADELRDRGLSASSVALDVADVDAVRAAVRAIDDERPLRTVVSCAGVAARTPVRQVEPADFDHLMAVNVRGLFFVMQAALRVMVPRGGGSVVNVSSTSGFTASTGPMVVYDASKAAVRMLTQAAAREVAGTGVRVNAVAPGTVETDLTRGLATAEQLAALAAERVPMRRLGRPQEIAAAVDYLSGADASYVTGHTLVVDGGWLA